MIHAEDGTGSGLAGLDLNLVVAFDALAREQNVTRAAARVGVTQSAMSHALRRLRTLLDDPLLVRGRGGMVLTPRAEALSVPLRSGLVTIHRALASKETFVAARARRTFSLASPDLFDALVLPALLDRMRKEAPGIDLHVAPLDGRRLADNLETGDLDFAVVPRVDDVEPADAPGLLRRTLFRDNFACLLRADHPAFRTARGRRQTRLGLETFAALSHVLVSPEGEGEGLVDRALTSRGLSRRIALRVPSFVSALPIVAESDLVLTAPTPLARLARPGAIVTLPPPLPVPGHSVDLLWHERFTREPGHRWMRAVLTEVASATSGAHVGRTLKSYKARHGW